MRYILISVIIIGLLVDQNIEYWGQIIVNIGVWLVFLGLLKYSERDRQISLILCLIYATVGEVFLSLIWQLYEYRLYNIPLFIPPGHAILFTLGLILAPKLPNNLIWGIPAITAIYTIFAIITGIDILGGILFIAFILCIIFGNNKQLYVTMFVLSLCLEVYGTTVGNWTWNYDEKWFGMTTTNPPVSAGAFYCMLDLLIVSTMRLLQNKRIDVDIN